jgi:hypothetical protein
VPAVVNVNQTLDLTKKQNFLNTLMIHGEQQKLSCSHRPFHTDKPPHAPNMSLTATEIDAMKVTELQDELKKRGLPVKGKKAELAAALLAAVRVGAARVCVDRVSARE